MPLVARDQLALGAGGYGTLGGASKTLRDAQMTYNCMDVDDAGKRTNCQSTLAKPYQQKKNLLKNSRYRSARFVKRLTS